jgi:hypothetical protein
MHIYRLTFTLLSDATFGRGEGIAGLIDREVEHDRFGLPYLRGRTLKGLVSEEADNLLFVLERLGRLTPEWTAARQGLFGRPGSATDDRGRLRFGHAELPAAVREAVLTIPDAGTDSNRLLVLESLTAIRRQTAIESDEKHYGVPAEGSLRSMRVILRQTPFEARLLSEVGLEKTPFDLALLAAAMMAFRRAGTGRNRGRGKLFADLLDAQGQSLLASGYEFFSSHALGLGHPQEAAS